MKAAKPCILAVNGGSSSIKFALYETGKSLVRLFEGQIEGVGLSRGSFTVKGLDKADTFSRPVVAPDHQVAVGLLMDWIQERIERGTLIAVGHRVVHGGPKYWEPQRITPEMIDELRQLSPFDPEHLPEEILLTEAFHQRFPDLPQVACFDTDFHHDMPRVAQLLPVPRRYEKLGVRRYGFHGLSYAYLMEELERLAGKTVANGRVILAHLGNGASMAAVRGGRSQDTTMGFTPAAGLVMSTRSGDLDPGLVAFLARSEKMTAAQFDHMVNHESGLLGVSETSSDMRDLLAHETEDVRAAEAVMLFCYQARKWIGAYAAVLGGLDTLIFAGGMGENSPTVRACICEGLQFLSIELNEARNAETAPVISTDTSRVTVRVIRTDEELMIARSVFRALGLGRAQADRWQPDSRQLSTRRTQGIGEPHARDGFLLPDESQSKTEPPASSSKNKENEQREDPKHFLRGCRFSTPNNPMLRSIKQLYGHSLSTAEGEIGKVKDFYFDDGHWAVRYVVADTDTWLAGRLVLISPHAFGSFHEDGDTLLVNLTREQIENSPAIESHKPVSRQFEEEYYRHYGWPTYWAGGGMWGWGTGGFPMVPPPPYPLPEAQAPAGSGSHQDDDPHLRSTKALSGYHIETPEGAIGHVTDFMIDDKSWAILHIVVETGHWYAGKEIVLSPSHIERISYDDSKVFVDLTKDIIRDAPEFLMPEPPYQDSRNFKH